MTRFIQIQLNWFIMLLVRTCGANSKCFVLFDRHMQPVREAVSYRGLFTAGWFGVREKHCSRLKIYDRLRASEQAGVVRGKRLI